MTVRTSVGIGIIGTGGAAQYLANKLSVEFNDRCHIVGVSGTDAGRLMDFSTQFSTSAFASDTELVGSSNVDAVIVASSGDAHESSVLASIAAKKPVFCEKPLATTSAACHRIIQAELAHGSRLVQVGFVRRFDPAYIELRKAITSGLIGQPLLFHSAHRNPAVHERFTNEMILNDVAVHDIDIARWLLDDEFALASAIHGRTNSKGRRDLVDPLFLSLVTKGGVLVCIELSTNCSFGYDIRGEVSGEVGVVGLSETSNIIVKSGGKVSGSVPQSWRERFDFAFSRELDSWLKYAKAGSAGGASAWDGLAATLVAESLQSAVSEGMQVVLEAIDPPVLYRSCV